MAIRFGSSPNALKLFKHHEKLFSASSSLYCMAIVLALILSNELQSVLLWPVLLQVQCL